MDGRRNWDWHNVVDISPFLRYESTGDSEVISDMNTDHAEVRNYEAHDDALSCCSDSYDTATCNKNYGDHDHKERAQSSKKKTKKKEATCLKNKSKKNKQDLGYNPNCRDCNDDRDEDDDATNQVWSSCGNIAASRQQKKSSKSSNANAFAADSSMEPKEENDKLFWDTCLDS